METSATPPTGSAIERVLVVQNKMGIHARPAAMIVRLTSKFNGEVFFEKDDEQVNGKSIMGLLTLGVQPGATVTLEADGEDAAQVMDELEKLLTKDIIE